MSKQRDKGRIYEKRRAKFQELQKKIERLRGRVKALEGALRTLQADVSDEPHPLLLDTDESTAIIDSTPTAGPSNPKSTSSQTAERDPPQAMTREDEEFVGAFGAFRRRLCADPWRLTERLAQAP